LEEVNVDSLEKAPEKLGRRTVQLRHLLCALTDMLDGGIMSVSVLRVRVRSKGSVCGPSDALAGV
jgi:hypothetical protein